MKINHEQTLRLINSKNIKVDPKGQRDVNSRKAQFRKIMKEFNPDLVNPIKVAFINGDYWVYDGQMTLKVLKARNGNRDLPVKCLVTEGLTFMEAADLFCEQSGITTRVTAAEKINAKANYGSKAEGDFLKIVEKNHFRIDGKKNYYDNSIKIQAVTALWKEYQLFADNNDFDEYLYVLYESFNTTPKEIGNKIIMGLGMFMRKYKGQYRVESLIGALSKARISDIIRDAEADRSSGARKYAVQILQVYNQYIRKNKLPNIL